MEKTDPGTKPGLHGNLKCSVPQSHSLCAASGLCSQSSESLQQAKATQEHSLFPTGFVFFCLCALKWQLSLSRGVGMHSWDRQEGKDHNKLQSGLFCQEPATLCVGSQPPEMTFWAPPLSCSDGSSGWMKYPGLWAERYSKWPWEPLLQRVCSKLVLLAHMLSLHENKIIVYKKETHFGYVQGKDLESQHIMVVRNITPLLKSAQILKH